MRLIRVEGGVRAKFAVAAAGALPAGGDGGGVGVVEIETSD